MLPVCLIISVVLISNIIAQPVEHGTFSLPSAQIQKIPVLDAQKHLLYTSAPISNTMGTFAMKEDLSNPAQTIQRPNNFKRILPTHISTNDKMNTFESNLGNERSNMKYTRDTPMSVIKPRSVSNEKFSVIENDLSPAESAWHGGCGGGCGGGWGGGHHHHHGGWHHHHGWHHG